MRSVFFVLLFLSASSILEASFQESISKCLREEGRCAVPEITYTQIKEAGLLNKRWGVLTLEGEAWHFHWHIDQEKRIEILFPPERFFYEVICVDTMHLKDSGACNTRFAAFEICPVPYSGKEVDRQKGAICAIFYTFYLAQLAFCRIGHN